MFIGTVEREHLDGSGSGESEDGGVFRQVFEESKGGTTAETSIVCEHLDSIFGVSRLIRSKLRRVVRKTRWLELVKECVWLHPSCIGWCDELLQVSKILQGLGRVEPRVGHE